MGEEGTNTATESQTESVSVGSVPTPSPPPPAPGEHSPVQEKEHNAIPVPKEQVTSPVIQKVVDPAARKDAGDSVNRDAVLARVETEKRLALIKAWEESEKTKAENRAYKRISSVGLWEDSKKASVEAELKKIEEKLERKKAEYVEKMKNKMAEIHRSAEEKRAMIEAQRGEEFVELEKTAAKFRTRGYTPRKLLACFSG